MVKYEGISQNAAQKDNDVGNINYSEASMWSFTYPVRIPEGEDGEEGRGILEKIMAENSSELIETPASDIGSLSKINKSMSTSRYIIIFYNFKQEEQC